MAQSTNYFSFFPKKIQDSYLITNLLARAKMRSAINLTQSKIFIPYTIKEGERPETISENIYGTTSYFWMVLYINEIKNIYEDWPKTAEVLNNYVINKYTSLEYAQNAAHHFEDSEGNWIGESDWDGTASTRYTLYDWEVKLNEDKRQIYLVRPEYQSKLAKEFKEIFRMR